jgi:redox-sensitive bicupin YhaK (pirin superfamily)
MSTIRKIRKILKSKPTIEGAGVHLKRAFGFSEAPLFDPFLLLDDFHSENPDDYLKGFPWHPHRGIETITYVLHGDVEHGDSMGNKGIINSGDVQWMTAGSVLHGDVEHGDSMGNKGIINSGDVQWMTAGSGVIHQEMPKGDDSGLMWGFQLWANLPASRKMMDPRYRDVKSEQIPEVTFENGVRIKVICGEVNGVKGPVKDIVKAPEYLDVMIPSGSELIHPVKEGHTVIAYVFEGKGYFCKEKNPFTYEVEGTNYFDIQRAAFVERESLVFFDNGDQIFASTEDEPVRFLLISGKPIGEPVAWYGPIVMNTQEELRIAFEEYQKGTFIKHKTK